MGVIGVSTDELFAGAVAAKIDELPLKIISRQHLIANKRAASACPQDALALLASP